jgi:hypothetical protein
MTSRCEFVDMTLTDGVDLDIAESLNSVLPEGIEVVSAAPIHVGTESLMKSISMTSYLITLSRDRCLGKSSLGRLVDVGLKKLPGDVRERISRVEAVGDRQLEMDLTAGEKGHPRPDRIVPELLSDLNLELNQLAYERIAQYTYENGRLVYPVTGESKPSMAGRQGRSGD